MEELFVTYEIALKLKELGFDEECINEYWFTCKKLRFSFESVKNIYHYKRSNSDNNDISLISAPLWQQVIDWFREKYNISLEIFTLSYHNSIQYCFNIKKLEDTTISVLHKDNVYYSSYYETRKQAILKAIELCQNKK